MLNVSDICVNCRVAQFRLHAMLSEIIAMCVTLCKFLLEMATNEWLMADSCAGVVACGPRLKCGCVFPLFGPIGHVFIGLAHCDHMF